MFSVAKRSAVLCCGSCPATPDLKEVKIVFMFLFLAYFYFLFLTPSGIFIYATDALDTYNLDLPKDFVVFLKDFHANAYDGLPSYSRELTRSRTH